MNRTAKVMPEQKKRQPARESKRRNEEAQQIAMHETQATRDRAPRSQGRARGPNLLICGAIALACTWACSKPEDKASKPIEIVDIDASTDADLSFEEDVQAQRRDDGLSGVLPGGFPEDLPLLEPASVVDTLESEDGRMVVVLQHTVSVEELESFLGRELPAAGWQTDGGSFYRNDQGRRVEIAVEAMGAVARVRITY